MGKAQKHKEERRAARQNAAERRHRLNKSAGLVAAVLCLAAILAFALPPLLKHKKSSTVSLTPSPSASAVAPVKSSEAPVTHPVMTISTAKGDIKVELRPDKAPKTVAQITTLINKGFYNGLKFHRVVPGFVVQGGDPKGDGTGGSDLPNIPFEANDLKHEKGVIAMARSQDKNSANSQYYITLDAQPSLDGEYVVFGKVISGQDVVDKITQGDVMTTVTLTQ